MADMDKLSTPGLIAADDGTRHCAWRAAMPDYHDEEWGRPVTDDSRLFEKICLEGFQSGLAWITILRKREQFRAAFDGFDFHRVARYGDADIARLLADVGIVRNRAKIVSTINNARRACELVDETGSLARWLWQFEPAADTRPALITFDYLQANTISPASEALSKSLKKRGWSFVGPTTMYALMQAVGMVNDHVSGCVCRSAVQQAREQLERHCID